MRLPLRLVALTCLRRRRRSGARLVRFVALATVHGAKRLAAREMAACRGWGKAGGGGRGLESLGFLFDGSIFFLGHNRDVIGHQQQHQPNLGIWGFTGWCRVLGVCMCVWVCVCVCVCECTHMPVTHLKASSIHSRINTANSGYATARPCSRTAVSVTNKVSPIYTIDPTARTAFRADLVPVSYVSPAELVPLKLWSRF